MIDEYFINEERDHTRSVPALVDEVERLRGEGIDRGWFCRSCRYWHSPWEPGGKFVLIQPCPRCGESMFPETQDSVRRRDAEEEAERLRAALRKIQEWDMLNPPQTHVVSDLDWLRRLVDDALAAAGKDIKEAIGDE